MVDESIKVKTNGFFWTAFNQARLIFGMRAAYTLPLDHPLAVFVERITDAVRTNNLVALSAFLAELTEEPPSEEVSNLLLAILRQMHNPALDAPGMRKLCHLYRSLVELLPYNPWLYRLVASEVRHWTDATPDRLLKALLVVYENRERIRRDNRLAFVMTWGDSPRVEGFFQERSTGHDDYGDTDGEIPTIVYEASFPGPLSIGPRRLTLPLKPLPVPKVPGEKTAS